LSILSLLYSFVENRPRYIKQFDKITFTLGVLNICATQYFIVGAPDKYWMWYSTIMPILMMGRWKHFSDNGFQYFMLDFCYSVNLLTLVHLFFLYKLSWAEDIFKVAYIMSTGPLPAAIPVWKNSLVFHDVDKMISVYVHTLPMCLYYTLRFNDVVSHDAGNLGLKDFGNAILFYVAWQLLYLVKTEVIDKEKLEQDANLLTSLKWLTTKKTPLGTEVLILCRKMGIFKVDENYSPKSIKTKLVFIMTQFVFTIISMIPTYFCWKYPAFNLFFICLIFTIAVFLGASYYVEIFSTRYSNAIEAAAAKAVLNLSGSMSTISSLARSDSNSNGGRVGGEEDDEDDEEEEEEDDDEGKELVEFDTSDIPGDEAFQEEEVDYLLEME